jgi:dolichol-phosphate mannosyltransferase
MEIAAVIPTLNEASNIEPLLEGIFAAHPAIHAIIVDDGSTDGTDEVVNRCAQKYFCDGVSKVLLIERGKKMGYASAVQDGMRLALEKGATRIVQMDADLSHNPEHLPAILAKSETCDLVLGSRYIPGGGTRNWGWDRKVLSGTANGLVRLLLGVKARDCTGGFRCWRRDWIEKCGILDLKVEGYAFLFIALDRAYRAGASIGEVPIIFNDREFGKSKMSRKIILEAMKVLFGLWWKRRFGGNR